MKDQDKMYGTTVLGIKKGQEVIIIADGQVSLGHTVMKSTAHKVKRLENGILCGFAGSTASAFTLFEELEASLSKKSNHLEHACVEVAKSIRNKMLKLEAMMIVADKDNIFILTGMGDVLKPQSYKYDAETEFTVTAIGSGGNFALSSALALCKNWNVLNKKGHNMSLREIAVSSMEIAADICIYSNNNFVIEEIKPSAKTLKK